MSSIVDPAELARLALRLAELRQEHRALDEDILRLQSQPATDELALRRMKKHKLQLKDRITRLESALIPDEPA